MRWNKRKPFFKFSARLLVRVDVVQVIKATVHSGQLFQSVSSNPEFFPSGWFFPPPFALLLSGECFTTKLKNTCKQSGTLEEKNIHTKKSLALILYQVKSFILFLLISWYHANFSFNKCWPQTCVSSYSLTANQTELK